MPILLYHQSKINQLLYISLYQGNGQYFVAYDVPDVGFRGFFIQVLSRSLLHCRSNLAIKILYYISQQLDSSTTTVYSYAPLNSTPIGGRNWSNQNLVSHSYSTSTQTIGIPCTVWPQYTTPQTYSDRNRPPMLYHWWPNKMRRNNSY